MKVIGRQVLREGFMTSSPFDDRSGWFEKNYDRIYCYVRGMVRDPNEAEDLTPEAFVRARAEIKGAATCHSL